MYYLRISRLLSLLFAYVLLGCGTDTVADLEQNRSHARALAAKVQEAVLRLQSDHMKMMENLDTAALARTDSLRVALLNDEMNDHLHKVRRIRELVDTLNALLQSEPTEEPEQTVLSRELASCTHELESLFEMTEAQHFTIMRSVASILEGAKSLRASSARSQAAQAASSTSAVTIPAKPTKLEQSPKPPVVPTTTDRSNSTPPAKEQAPVAAISKGEPPKAEPPKAETPATSEAPKPKPTPIDGGALYAEKCAKCHAGNGNADTKTGKKYKMRDLRSKEVQQQSNQELYAWIADGKEKMPGYAKKLSEAEIRALVELMRRLK